jgi:predicted MFS family arabinose efflux permease
VTYREVLGVGEFRALFFSQLLSLVGDHIARIAIALLVFQRTNSAFAASATYGCSYLTWLIGGPVLSVLADRYRRRQIMIVTDVARGALLTLLLLPHPPLWLVFSVLVLVGLLAPPFESARSAILPDILEGERYITANTLMNTMLQGAQVGGFFFGGVLVAFASPRGAIAFDVVTYGLSALLVGLAVRDRPAVSGSTGRFVADLTSGFWFVLRDPLLRGLLTYGALASIAGIVPEGLAIAVAHDAGGGAVAAGILTAALPLGYVVASTVMLRVAPAQRMQLLRPLTALLCIPLLATPLITQTPLTAVVWVIAGLGTSVQLIASVTYVAATPAQYRGRAFGIASTVLMLSQGAALLVSGAFADALGSRNVVAATAAVVLAMLVVVRITLPGDQPAVQGIA